MENALSFKADKSKKYISRKAFECVKLAANIIIEL